MFNKICDFFTRLLPVWVVLAGVIGYFFPNSFVFLRHHTEWLFMFTMLGIGAVLALKHFSAQTAIPNALFATWCVITASILAEIWRER